MTEAGGMWAGLVVREESREGLLVGDATGILLAVDEDRRCALDRVEGLLAVDLDRTLLRVRRVGLGPGLIGAAVGQAGGDVAGTRVARALRELLVGQTVGVL